jgi:sulfite reductase (NADPH) hemoprotein beta-component
MKDGPSTLTTKEIERIKSHFTAPDYVQYDNTDSELALQAQAQKNPAFANWLSRNTHLHKQAGYKSVTLSLKVAGVAPGDITDVQMEAAADLADKFSFGEIRSSHQQNLILADVKKSDLLALWSELQAQELAKANIGTLTDMICCPGGDYCALANAKSIPVAEQITRKFNDLDYLYDLGDIELNISGCMNACGHHHVGHIGILGVAKKGQEYFQVSLGGSQDKDASLGKILGPSFKADEIPNVLEKLLNVFVEQREEEEHFLDCYRRLGIDLFKEAVYA